jgi:glycerol-3-phosphate dehydrogenase
MWLTSLPNKEVFWSFCSKYASSAARVQVRREDVQSVWCGIRPLAKDPSATDTADAVRDHLVIAEKNGMVTVTGGKWTTYRCCSLSQSCAKCCR